MSSRPGFDFSTIIKVRYAEIDGQRIVYNSRYLEYADFAADEFWAWSGIAAIGPEWTEAEFHVRHTEIDYLKPFRIGDVVEVFVRIARIGTTSLTTRFELCHATTGEQHCAIEMVIVHVGEAGGRPAPLPERARAALAAMMAGADAQPPVA